MRWKNEQYDRLIDQAKETADAAARYKVYAQAEKVILDEVGMVPLYMRMQLSLKQPNVKNVHLTPFRYLPFGDVEMQ